MIPTYRRHRQGVQNTPRCTRAVMQALRGVRRRASDVTYDNEAGGLDTLGDLVLAKVFSYFPFVPYHATVSRVCKRFSRVLQCDQYWRERMAGKRIPKLPGVITPKRSFLWHVIHKGRCCMCFARVATECITIAKPWSVPMCDSCVSALLVTNKSVGRSSLAAPYLTTPSKVKYFFKCDVDSSGRGSGQQQQRITNSSRRVSGAGAPAFIHHSLTSNGYDPLQISNYLRGT